MTGQALNVDSTFPAIRGMAITNDPSSVIDPDQRGRKVVPEAGAARKIAQLEKANARLAEKLRKAEFIIGFQKKMAILWASPNPDGNEEND